MLKRQLKAIQSDISEIFSEELGSNSKDIIDTLKDVDDPIEKAKRLGELTQGLLLYRKVYEYFEMIMSEVDK